MKIINVDNEYLQSHRYGWYNIINYIKNNIDTDILLIDYVDKYFNAWLELPKEIICDNKVYHFQNKDAYYHVNDKDKNDIFIYYDSINIYHFIKWYPEYNEFKILYGEVIQNMIKKYNISIIEKPWIGIIHYPEFIKEMNYSSTESFEMIIQTDIFIKSLKNCKCLITLSNYLKNYIYNILQKYNYNINIYVLYHPTDFNCKLFSYNSFLTNNYKSIIQIGFWMRKMNTIFLLQTKFNKLWFPGGDYWFEMFKIIYPNYTNYLNDSSVEIKLNLSNEMYDDYLSKNICLLNVFNASANNTLLECIVRNTPIIVNKHPAIIEYLGIDYPLYFNNMDELNILVNSNTFYEQILNAHIYLYKMDKTIFTIDNFSQSFHHIINQ